MRSLGPFAVLLAALLFCTAALASGRLGHHGGYSRHADDSGDRTGFYPKPYGYMSPYQAFYIRHVMMKRR